MSSFDEAFRSESAKQQDWQATQQRVEEVRRRAAEAAAPKINQMIRDLARTLADRGVPLTQIELSPPKGLLRRGGQKSPQGFAIFETRHSGWSVMRVTLVTPDGQIWYCEGYPSSYKGDFVPLTAEALLRGLGALGHIRVLDDGRIGNTYGEDLNFIPVETILAQEAQRVIAKASRQH